VENKINIRNYSHADYEQVKRILVDGGLFYQPLDSSQRLEEKILRDPSSILVAEESDRVVGTVSLMEDSRMAFIFRLAVNPENQNRGLGKALMSEAEKELFRRGHREINILVEEDNIGLQEYYEKQDYGEGNLYRWRTKERKG